MTLFLKKGKNLILLLTLFQLSIFSGNAQRNFAPLDAYWNYFFSEHRGAYYSNETVRVTKDTLIDGYPTKFLTRYYKSFGWTSDTAGQENLGILKIKNDSVFFTGSFEFSYVEDLFIYGFSMKSGDTIHINTSGITYAIVDSIDSITHKGVLLKRWHLSKYGTLMDNGNARKVTIIENIGPVDEDLLISNWSRYGAGIGTREFKCFKSANLTYNEPCNPITSITSPSILNSPDFITYTNPVLDKLQIKFESPLKGIWVKIFNMDMKEVYSINYSNTQMEVLDLSDLKSGLYLLQLESNGNLITKRFFKLK